MIPSLISKVHMDNNIKYKAAQNKNTKYDLKMKTDDFTLPHIHTSQKLLNAWDVF